MVTAVRGLLADRLALTVDRIALDSRLIDDLGADSLDFIDIVFSLEKRFGIRIREEEFDFLSRLDFASPEVMRDGFLTADTVAKLRRRLPALGTVADPARVTPAALFGLLTVATLCDVVEARLTETT
jgi:acyl carrier protein